MRVMTNHKWFDEDIDRVLWGEHQNNREIVFKENIVGAIVLNIQDVIALAKEFGLVVYERGSDL